MVVVGNGEALAINEKLRGKNDGGGGGKRGG